MGEDTTDRWTDWVLRRGHAGDAEQKRKSLAFLGPIRDRVLEGAVIEAGDDVLDVGSGDGLIAFAALPLVGDAGRVIFSDVSSALLDHCRATAERLGVVDRTRFVPAPAQDLSPIETSSVDAVTVRSVLIYVDDKAAAFREFARVLKPGGRLSLFEPINRYFDECPDRLWGFDTSPVRGLVAKIAALEGWDRPDPADPMMNFGERDLFDHAEAAGFSQIHLELALERMPGSWITGWDAFLDTAPNPNARTTRESIDAALTPQEADRLEAHLRPLVESDTAVRRSAFAYLRARKG